MKTELFRRKVVSFLFRWVAHKECATFPCLCLLLLCRFCLQAIKAGLAVEGEGALWNFPPQLHRTYSPANRGGGGGDWHVEIPVQEGDSRDGNEDEAGL